MKIARLALALCGPALLLSGCAKRAENAAAEAAPAKAEHHPPHGGTPVVLGNELYHLELVRDSAAGTLSVYVLDGEMEEFVRSPAASITIDARVNHEVRPLILSAVANAATGETVGDTALFPGQADWLKTKGSFDAVLESISIRGATFASIKFNFPSGNDPD